MTKLIRLNSDFNNNNNNSRNADKEFAHSDLNGNSETKNMWESISNLCDFSSKTGPKSTKDASRIRQIFLQMKSSPPTKVN